MKFDHRKNVMLLLSLRKAYGDLNRALVAEYVKAYGPTSIRKMSMHLGLSRTVIRRALSSMSFSDRQESRSRAKE